ncbi:DUF1642 domain-containing protein [Enterococcus faecium]|nr:DUF1642 domain-containing protein [Enterococcus faecium]EME7158849.1 DUF1642 domain-containing protein [Enterococcus faecium]
MNKQKLIETLEELKENAKRYIEIEKYEDYWRGKTEAYVNLIGLAKQLDEPQKPVVPKFVAEWIEKLRKQIVPYHFESGARFMMFIGRDFHHKKGLILINEEIRQWLEKDGNEVILSNAIDYGYEVEKEPLYRVKLGEDYFVEYQGRGALIMIIPDDNKEIKIFDSKSDAERTAQTIGGTVEEVTER